MRVVERWRASGNRKRREGAKTKTNWDITRRPGKSGNEEGWWWRRQSRRGTRWWINMHAAVKLIPTDIPVNMQRNNGIEWNPNLGFSQSTKAKRSNEKIVKEAKAKSRIQNQMNLFISLISNFQSLNKRSTMCTLCFRLSMCSQNIQPGPPQGGILGQGPSPFCTHKKYGNFFFVS